MRFITKTIKITDLMENEQINENIKTKYAVYHDAYKIALKQIGAELQLECDEETGVCFNAFICAGGRKFELFPGQGSIKSFFKDPAIVRLMDELHIQPPFTAISTQKTAPNDIDRSADIHDVLMSMVNNPDSCKKLNKTRLANFGCIKDVTVTKKKKFKYAITFILKPEYRNYLSPVTWSVGIQPEAKRVQAMLETALEGCAFIDLNRTKTKWERLITEQTKEFAEDPEVKKLCDEIILKSLPLSYRHVIELSNTKPSFLSASFKKVEGDIITVKTSQGQIEFDIKTGWFRIPFTKEEYIRIASAFKEYKYVLDHFKKQFNQVRGLYPAATFSYKTTSCDDTTFAFTYTLKCGAKKAERKIVYEHDGSYIQKTNTVISDFNKIAQECIKEEKRQKEKLKKKQAEEVEKILTDKKMSGNPLVKDICRIVQQNQTFITAATIVSHLRGTSIRSSAPFDGSGIPQYYNLIPIKDIERMIHKMVNYHILYERQRKGDYGHYYTYEPGTDYLFTGICKTEVKHYGRIKPDANKYSYADWEALIKAESEALPEKMSEKDWERRLPLLELPELYCHYPKEYAKIFSQATDEIKMYIDLMAKSGDKLCKELKKVMQGKKGGTPEGNPDEKSKNR